MQTESVQNDHDSTVQDLIPKVHEDISKINQTFEFSSQKALDEKHH